MAEKEPSLSDLTLVAIEAALLAGEILRQGFGSHFKIFSKEGKHNLVTEYDHMAEKAILEFLQNNIPSSHFLSEEKGASGNDQLGTYWIVDPLDGTVNFAHQIPVFSVSIAAQKNNQTLSAVIYQPITHELFVAELGKGAFLNGKKIEVSHVDNLDQAILATGFPYDLISNPFYCIEHFVDVLKLGIPIRRLGSAAIDLAYTASGRFEAFFEAKLSPWDVAAGKLLIEEAGGKISHWDNTPFDIHSEKTLLASNGKIHDALSETLTREVASS